MTTWKVPLADVRLGPEEEAGVAEGLRSGWLSQGPRVERFEAEFARFLNVKHALAVASGTAALHLAHGGARVSEVTDAKRYHQTD